MSEPRAPEVLVIERAFDAPPAAVFDAFTTEAVMRCWWHARREWTTSEASVDLRVGGALRVVMRDTDGDEHGGGGNYTEVDRPNRLAFTWTWDGSERETLIEIDFAAATAGTVVTFTHSNLADLESARDHEDGWNKCFDNLVRALAEAGAGRETEAEGTR